MANVMKISPKPVSLTNVSAHQWDMKFGLQGSGYQAPLSLDAHWLAQP